MWDSLYPIVAVLLISFGVFLFGFVAALVFLPPHMVNSARTHPRTVRWVSVVLVMTAVFLFLKFLRPFYYGIVVGIGLFLFVWGFLSQLEKRLVFKEVFTLDFWVPNEGSRAAKNGL